MKIVTWNINGIRTFKGGVKKVLDLLDADIVCVQETKVTRDLLDEKTAIIDGYNSYFSFSRGRSGYSAEEGLTGLLTNKDGGLGCYGDQTNFTPEELQLLDNEGRAVLTQHRVRCGEQEETLTLINVYCPRADPDRPERGQFKLHFYNLLQMRAEAVLGAGSHVIVLGDFNTSHKPIDHCDPDEIENFEDSPSRRWLNGFLCGPLEEPAEAGETPQARGGFIDTFRHFHPSRHGAFTCWSTVTGARRTNYGTRIDYILASRALALLHFVEADISPEVEGSDHCPVWGHLCCELLPSPRCPPLCTRRMPEFTGRQQKLSRFLVKVEQPPETLPGSQDPLEVRENVCPDGNAAVKRKGATVQLSSSSSSSKAKKSKVAPDVPKPQGNLLSFFKPRPVPFVQPEDKSNAHNLVADNGSRPQSSTPAGAVPGFWKSLLRGPPQPPLCRTHQEPCVLRTVKKAGPNVGRQFFVCARPQGHASNPEARCDFFSWVEQDK